MSNNPGSPSSAVGVRCLFSQDALNITGPILLACFLPSLMLLGLAGQVSKAKVAGFEDCFIGSSLALLFQVDFKRGD